MAFCTGADMLLMNLEHSSGIHHSRCRRWLWHRYRLHQCADLISLVANGSATDNV